MNTLTSARTSVPSSTRRITTCFLCRNHLDDQASLNGKHRRAVLREQRAAAGGIFSPANSPRPACGTGLISRWRGLSLPLVLLALALALLPGCASVRTPEFVASVAGTTAYVGTTAWLIEHPGDRALFVTAHAELTAALAARNFEAEAFASIMRNLPVLRDGKHALYAGLAVMLWNDLVGDATLVDRPGAVRTVMESVRDQLGRALGLSREGAKEAKANPARLSAMPFARPEFNPSFTPFAPARDAL